MGEKFDNLKEHSHKKDEYHIGPFGRSRSDYLPNISTSLSSFVYNLYDIPATWLHDKVITPNRKQSVYYHFKYPRVPTVDECYVDDYACLFEADEQYKRDRRVEKYIIGILNKRYKDCVASFGGLDSNSKQWCTFLQKDIDEAQTNYMIKYGELPNESSSPLNLMEAKTRSADVYLKQKHRYIWERKQALKAEKEHSNSPQETM